MRGPIFAPGEVARPAIGRNPNGRRRRLRGISRRPHDDIVAVVSVTEAACSVVLVDVRSVEQIHPASVCRDHDDVVALLRLCQFSSRRHFMCHSTWTSKQEAARNSVERVTNPKKPLGCRSIGRYTAQTLTRMN